ncbi:MAG: TIGR04086 family membrane protein [Lachnospiraceae bacterium]|nr:TIGR04086 family membrane protein [Lachnospiraceae bacterium]
MEALQGKGRAAAELLKGLLLACFVTTALLLLLAFAMLKFQPLAEKMEICILVTYVFSCLAGGWYCGRRAERRKFLRGLLLGAVYFALLFLISGMGDRAVQSNLLQSATAFVLCACGGMLGGMLAG